jgi:hypothetical protein
MSNNYLRLSDGTTWPDPHDPSNVEWELRYGEPTREQMLFAASVISAYSYLVLGLGRSQLALLQRTAKALPQETETQ